VFLAQHQNDQEGHNDDLLIENELYGGHD